MTAIERLRQLLELRDGRIQLLYETIEAALAELDREYVRRQPAPVTPLR